MGNLDPAFADPSVAQRMSRRSDRGADAAHELRRIDRNDAIGVALPDWNRDVLAVQNRAGPADFAIAYQAAGSRSRQRRIESVIEPVPN
jgi:hypothetical protein